ncbi:MAG TPA: amidohydrolase/deacetylase family metallohydrolase [Bryobacteraceae bacterium]|nr:amidohydrolase/deacetylase family metallohydrolase [Bryobacteraceae bacterium]
MHCNVRIGWLAVLALGVLAVTAGAQPRYDLLLKGGHVIDARNNIDRVTDVAIANGKIARVADNIPAAEAKRTVNVSGLYVTPGIIDIHVHVYAGTGRANSYAGDWGLYPDGFTFRNGVTTVCDAGTSGWRNFPDFKDRVIDRAKTRVLAWVNIEAYGMENAAVQQDPRNMDADAAARCVRDYPEIIIGIKTAHYAGPDWSALEGAIAAGTMANVPVMVDYGAGHPKRPFPEALKKMRPGDIYTHFYGRPRPLLDAEGNLRPEFVEARRRGVLFDVGHGEGSFLFRQAVPAIAKGFIPDSISTDLHAGNMNGGMKNILNVMSKLMNIGMSLQEVVRRATLNPAMEIKRPQLGNLSVGSDADVAVLRVLQGDFGFVDVNGARMSGSQKLEAELTVHNGRVVWDLNGLTRDDWRKLPRDYGLQGDDSWDATMAHEGQPGR